MNCDKTKKWLLACHPDEHPSQEVQSHLISCKKCSRLQKNLISLENRVAGMPVPPSRKKDSFLEQVRNGQPFVKDVLLPDQWLQQHRLLPRERGVRKVSLAVALAACLAIVALGLWFGNLKPGNTIADNATNPLLSLRENRDRLLASAHSPREKVELLGKLANSLQKEAIEQAKKTDHTDLGTTSRFFREVIGSDLIPVARQLAVEDRKAVLQPIVIMLANLESEIQRTRGTISDSTFRSLEEMVLEARNTQNQLDNLING
jgi:hypothetical protein